MTVTAWTAISAVLNGDARQIDALEKFSPDDLSRAATGQHLALAGPAVARVLRDLAEGHIDATLAQRWASFVRYGFVAGPGAASGFEIAIDYEAAREDPIVAAVGRLDELGDVIDGDLLPGEIDQLLTALDR